MQTRSASKSLSGGINGERYAAMVEAIATRDPDAAERAARLHVANARRAFFGRDRVPAGTPRFEEALRR